MHNKSFFVRHIYSRILKTILEPPSVGDKKSLDVAFQNSMYTKYTYYFLLSQKMYADDLVYRIHNILPITNLFWYRIRQCLLLFGQN